MKDDDLNAVEVDSHIWLILKVIMWWKCLILKILQNLLLY